MLSRTLNPATRFLPEAPGHDAAIAAICEEAFGPGRFARAAERVREMTPHERSLSFVAECGAKLIGSVRQTAVAIGGCPVIMLGPLAVRPAFKGQGAGRTLMRMAAQAAQAAGETAIFLVGDRSYYMPLGYRPLSIGSVTMPGPVDEARILGLELAPGGLDGLWGAVGRRG